MARLAHENTAAHQAALAAGTNRQYVSDAQKIKDEKPELYAQIKDGEVTLTQAAQKAGSIKKPRSGKRYR
ncbi:MAG: hypothetical protein PHY16_16500 [Methylobacter sp.]|nr:hypothetical protein [Methylobacter sp.]